MRIAQIAPIWERVPPHGYGGTELVVSLLTEELVRRGHQVTLFAAGDAQTSAKLISGYPVSFRETNFPKPVFRHVQNKMISQAFAHSLDFDVIHSHVGTRGIWHSLTSRVPVIHTLHGPVLPTLTTPLLSGLRENPVKALKPRARSLWRRLVWPRIPNQFFVSISDSQRHPDLEIAYISTVYNAIDHQSFTFYEAPEEPPYLAFLGRLSPEKGTHHAIKIARESGIPLRIAGKVDPVDKAYFKDVIEPQIDGVHIQYLGEANHPQKNALMGGAIATLFPITWSEPFGLVMIESMASGTPVIALEKGSTREVIADGKTGFLCQTVEECVAAVARVRSLNRQDCRNHVAQRFGVGRMTDDYEAVYQQAIAAFPRSKAESVRN